MSCRLLMAVCLVLAACGYHLAGQGRGVIPADVHALSVVATSNSSRSMLALIKRSLAERSDRYVLVDPGEGDAELHIDGIQEQFVPISFNASGVDTVYRLSINGSLSLWRKGERIWSSGAISVNEDIYAVADPTSIEATRRRIRRDLMRKWLREALLRLYGG